MATQKYSLNIGAGHSKRRPGVINADLFPGDNIDVVFDANATWPFKTASLHDVHASHVLEHLPSMETFFREAHRCVEPSHLTNVYIRLPYGPSEAGFGDVTHIRQYTASSFACFTPGWKGISNNRQYDTPNPLFVIDRILLMIDSRLRWWLRPIIRRATLHVLPFLWSGFQEMVIEMHHATPGDTKFRPVPLAYGIYESQYRNQSKNSGKIMLFK